MSILFLYWIYIKSMNISHYGFFCLVNFSIDKYIRIKKKKFLDIFWERIHFRYPWIIREYFPADEYYSYSYSHVFEFTNYSYSYLYRSWLRESIPNPICRKNSYLLITALCFKCDQCNFETAFEREMRYVIRMKHIISQLDGGDDTGMIKQQKISMILTRLMVKALSAIGQMKHLNLPALSGVKVV